MPAAASPDVPREVPRQVQRYAESLIVIAKCDSVNVLPRVLQSWTNWSPNEVAAGVHSWHSVLLASGIAPLLIKTTAHVANLAAAKGPTSLLEQSTACDAVNDLSYDLWKLIVDIRPHPPSGEYGPSFELIQQSAASGMKESNRSQTQCSEPGSLHLRLAMALHQAAGR